MPRPPRVRRTPALRAHPARAALADRGAHRIGEGRCQEGTYLAAHHAQIRGRRGEAKAIGATRHDILVAYFHIVRDEVEFRELGPAWQRKRYSPERRARRLQRQIEALGYQVTLQPSQETAPAG